MSTKEVYDYVMHTPRNTNPAVLNSMLGHLSWNDLKDKPFGTGTETVVVLEETTLMNFNTAGTAEFTPAASLEEGKTYTVVWNGTKYSCVAFYLKAWGGCCIGNRSKIGFTDNTGEPFAIITGNSTSVVVAGKGCTTATVSITTEEEIVHTIDPKYFPAGSVGYTEDKTIVIVDEVTATKAYTSQLFPDFMFVEGETYTVIINGEEHEVIAINIGEGPYLVKEGFFTIYRSGTVSLSNTIELPATISIVQRTVSVKTIDSKYLPCDLMFKVGCTGTAHPNMNPNNMTKPTIVSGSLEAVLEKLANGEIPVVKVQYMGVWDKSNSVPLAYGGEFTCGTWLYGTDVMFTHDIPNRERKYTVQITMNTDDPTFIEMNAYIGTVVVSVVPIN